MTGVKPDPDEWLDQASIETLECRTLRHQWPRTPRPEHTRRRTNKRNLNNDDHTVWKIIGAIDAGHLIERHITCIAGCGTTRTETFLVRHDGRMIRDGAPRYHYLRPYLRRRTEPDTPLNPIGQDDILGAIVRRIYPELRW